MLSLSSALTIQSAMQPMLSVEGSYRFQALSAVTIVAGGFRFLSASLVCS